MSEDQKGYAEGIDRTEAKIQMMNNALTILSLNFAKKLDELERRVDELEANQAWKGPNG